MHKAELIKALKKLQVQTGSLACLGCGYEKSRTNRFVIKPDRTKNYRLR